MNLLTRLREFSEKADAAPWTIEESWCDEPNIPEAGIGDNCISKKNAFLIVELRNNIDKILDVVEAAKECTRFYAIPGEVWEKLEDCIDALERET